MKLMENLDQLKMLPCKVIGIARHHPKVNLPIPVEIDHCHIIAKGGGQAGTREDQIHRQVPLSHRVCPEKRHLATVTSSGSP